MVKKLFFLFPSIFLALYGLSFPQITLGCTLFDTRFDTNKWDHISNVEEGGWKVAWGREITETDMIEGVIAAGVNIYQPETEAFSIWLNELIDDSINKMEQSLGNLAASIAREEMSRIVTNAKYYLIDVLKGKTPKGYIINIGKISLKVGMSEFNGHNQVCLGNFSGTFWQTSTSTLAYAPYVAIKLEHPDDNGGGDGGGGGSGGGGGGGGADYETIVISNDCQRADNIWVAIHYLDLGNIWQSGGFWKLAFGENITAAYTRNTIFYLTAFNESRTLVWQGNEGPWTLYNQNYNFLKITADFGSFFGTFLQRLTC